MAMFRILLRTSFLWACVGILPKQVVGAARGALSLATQKVVVEMPTTMRNDAYSPRKGDESPIKLLRHVNKPLYEMVKDVLAKHYTTPDVSYGKVYHFDWDNPVHVQDLQGKVAAHIQGVVSRGDRIQDLCQDKAKREVLFLFIYHALGREPLSKALGKLADKPAQPLKVYKKSLLAKLSDTDLKDVHFRQQHPYLVKGFEQHYKKKVLKKKVTRKKKKNGADKPKKDPFDWSKVTVEGMTTVRNLFAKDMQKIEDDAMQNNTVTKCLVEDVMDGQETFEAFLLRMYPGGGTGGLQSGDTGDKGDKGGTTDQGQGGPNSGGMGSDKGGTSDQGKGRTGGQGGGDADDLTLLWVLLFVGATLTVIHWYTSTSSGAEHEEKRARKSEHQHARAKKGKRVANDGTDTLSPSSDARRSEDV